MGPIEHGTFLSVDDEQIVTVVAENGSDEDEKATNLQSPFMFDNKASSANWPTAAADLLFDRYRQYKPLVGCGKNKNDEGYVGTDKGRFKATRLSLHIYAGG